MRWWVQDHTAGGSSILCGDYSNAMFHNSAPGTFNHLNDDGFWGGQGGTHTQDDYRVQDAIHIFKR